MSLIQKGNSYPRKARVGITLMEVDDPLFPNLCDRDADFYDGLKKILDKFKEIERELFQV